MANDVPPPRRASDDEEALETRWACDIVRIVESWTAPTTTEQSLMVYALIHAAGILLARCPSSQRGAVVESLQNHLARKAKLYGAAATLLEENPEAAAELDAELNRGR